MQMQSSCRLGGLRCALGMHLHAWICAYLQLLMTNEVREGSTPDMSNGGAGWGDQAV